MLILALKNDGIELFLQLLRASSAPHCSRNLVLWCLSVKQRHSFSNSYYEETLSSHLLQFLVCVCVRVCTLVQAWTCVCVVIVFFVQILVSFLRMDLPYLLTWFEWVVVSIKILELSISWSKIVLKGSWTW